MQLNHLCRRITESFSHRSRSHSFLCRWILDFAVQCCRQPGLNHTTYDPNYHSEEARFASDAGRSYHLSSTSCHPNHQIPLNIQDRSTFTSSINHTCWRVKTVLFHRNSRDHWSKVQSHPEYLICSLDHDILLFIERSVDIDPSFPERNPELT